MSISLQCKAVLYIGVVCCGLTETAAAPLVLVDSAEKSIIWTVGTRHLVSSAGANLSIAVDPVSKDSTVGFSHSGYTAKEPGGKNAVLTLMVNVEPVAIPGGTDSVAWSLPQSLELDIQLPMNLPEEARLRAVGGFPRKMLITSPSVIQLNWKNTPGRDIFNWLTDEKGLRFIAKARLPSVSLNVEATSTANLSKFDAWWSSKFSSDQVGVVDSSVSALVLDALGSGVAIHGISPSEITVWEADALQFGVHSKIDACVFSAAVPLGLAFNISRDAVLSCLKQSQTFVMRSPGRWRSSLPMKDRLPDSNVIDGSLGKPGLSALLLDGS